MVTNEIKINMFDIGKFEPVLAIKYVTSIYNMLANTKLLKGVAIL